MKDLLANRKDPVALSKVFTEQVLPRHPPIFYTWFLESFPEPAKWLASRAAYTATIAVMSMVGYVVGLGDRHGENILFDEMSGDGLHVDLNCLFEKGKDFEIPERVPFRLTHNMVDAFGVMGVKGPFTKSCEVSMNVLRSNRELLMSVLETFLHDPLCEWSKHAKAGIAGNLKAVNSLRLIDEKLQGLSGTPKRATNVSGQVLDLINQATDPKNLAMMYIGWAPYI
jgi:serine/threonine-protein kinase ATR